MSDYVGSVRAIHQVAKKSMADAIGRPGISSLLAALFRNQIPHYESVIDTSGGVVTFSTKAALFWRVYEAAEIRLARRYLRGDLDVVELGSSIGVLSSHIARKLAPSRRLICVEANPRLLDVLRRNVVSNVPNVRFHLLHAAVHYSTDGRRAVRFHTAARNTDSKVSDPASVGDHAVVPTITLAQIARTYELKQYALVSDIEGAEAGLIDCETEALSGCCQLIVELHQTSYSERIVSVTEMYDTLVNKHGFVLRDRKGAVCCFERG